MPRKTNSYDEKIELEKCKHESKDCQCKCCKVEFCRECFAQHEIDRETERFRVNLTRFGQFQNSV